MKSWHAVKQLIQLGLMVLFTALGLACGGGKDVVGPPPPPPPPLRASVIIDVIGGKGQTDTVARPLVQPVVAQASDSATKVAAPNVVVNWFRVAGKDTIFVGAALTDGGGQAKLQWTLLPLAGDQSVIAWVIDTAGKRATYADVHATAVPDQPDTVVLSTTSIVTWVGTKTTAPGLVSHVADQYGNATAGVATFAVQKDTSWGLVGDGLVAYYEDQENTAVLVGTASAQLSITAYRDLTKSAWSAGYSCIGYAQDMTSQLVDTAMLVGVVDSLHGGAPGAGYATWLGGRVQHHVTQTGYQWSTSWVDTLPFSAQRNINAQALGSIHWATGETAQWDGAAYVGGELSSICADYLRTRGFQRDSTLQQLRLQSK